MIVVPVSEEVAFETFSIVVHREDELFRLTVELDRDRAFGPP